MKNTIFRLTYAGLLVAAILAFGAVAGQDIGNWTAGPAALGRDDDPPAAIDGHIVSDVK